VLVEEVHLDGGPAAVVLGPSLALAHPLLRKIKPRQVR
jgi:hypothetical protein